VRLTTPGAVAGVELYRGKEPGACFRLSSGGAASDLPDSDGSTVAVAADGNWHELRLTVNGRQVVPMVDRQAGKAVALPVTLGGTALLRVAGGTAEFDDVEFSLPRRAKNEFLYVFDRRETDWWRTGGEWIDHGGISCALASQWISLVAPEGSGILWNKRGFPSASGADLLVTATLEENTEWFGWHQAESHIHHPYDNVCIYLTQDNNPETGYRVELNARQRTATVLYRNNVEVATVRQDSLFPLQYVGGHVPYSPRRSRLAVVKRGGTVAVVLNGREILSFADPAPLPVSRVGVGGYQTRVNFSRVEIREW
jgi:hypothetical protein